MLPCVCLMTNLGRYFVFRTRAASQHQPPENDIDSSLLSLDIAVCLQSTPFLVPAGAELCQSKLYLFIPTNLSS